MSFSTVSMSELQQLGVQYGRLIINEPVLATLASSPPPKVATEIQVLTGRLIEIYDCVNMNVSFYFSLFFLSRRNVSLMLFLCQYEAGTHMLLDAILLSLRRIASAPPLDVAIFPELPLASADGAHITNYRSGYELFLTGSIDYAVIQYEDVKDYKGALRYVSLCTFPKMVFVDRLLLPDAFRDCNTVFQLARCFFFLVEAKRKNPDRSSLASFVPEAVSQAIVLAKSTK